MKYYAHLVINRINIDSETMDILALTIVDLELSGTWLSVWYLHKPI